MDVFTIYKCKYRKNIKPLFRFSRFYCIFFIISLVLAMPIVFFMSVWNADIASVRSIPSPEGSVLQGTILSLFWQTVLVPVQLTHATA